MQGNMPKMKMKKKKMFIVFSQYRKLLDVPDITSGFIFSYIADFKCNMKILNFLRGDFLLSL